MKKMVSLLLVVFVISLMPMTAFAGSKKVYSDVNARTVDKQSYAAILYVKNHGGWKGLIRKNKLYPNRLMTRREFLIVLHNLYGDAVSANIGDVVAANAKVTSEFVCNRFVALSQALNFKIKWSGYKNKMTRKDVARYIVLFASYNAALAPRK